jgi:hypothetical protein
MNDVVGVLEATLSALGDSSDPRKESLLVYAIKLEIRRVLVSLESAGTPLFAMDTAAGGLDGNDKFGAN